MQCQAGFLLATHLLSPLLTTDKTRCLGKPPPSLTSTAARIRLPKELVQKIVFQLDHDTFQGIHAVSRLFREFYILNPRIGDHFLLAYVTGGNYRVLDTTTGDTTTAHLQRCGQFNACRQGLAHSFQHIQTVPYNLDPRPYKGVGILHGHDSERGVPVVRPIKHREGENWTRMRLQAVYGIWRFVNPAEAKSNFPKALEYDEERDECQDSSSYLNYRWEEFDM